MMVWRMGKENNISWALLYGLQHSPLMGEQAAVVSAFLGLSLSSLSSLESFCFGIHTPVPLRDKIVMSQYYNS